MTTPIGSKEAVESIAKLYGPFAFGIVSLLIIWLTIIQPELNSKRLDFEEYQKALERLSDQNIQSETTARTLRDTAIILDRVSTRLQNLSDGK